MLKKLILKLGLKPEATEDEVLALVAGQAQEAVALKVQTAVLPEIALAVGLEQTATPAQIKGAVLALKQGQGELEAFKTRVETLETERLHERAQAAVDAALKAGKLIPAESTLALEDAKRDLEGFKARMALRPKLVPVGEEFRMARETGKSGDLPADAPPDQVLALKAQRLAKEKGIDLAEAQRQVMADNPEAARQWHGANVIGA